FVESLACRLLESCGEVPQEGRFVGDLQAFNLIALAPDFEDYFDDVVNVALGIGAARDGEADEVHLGGFPKHQGADLDRADTAFEIEFVGERDTGELLQRDVRNEGASVEIDG